MAKRIFISKNLNETGDLESFCQTHDLELTSRSFLSFKPMAFRVEQPYDVIFFSSPRSVTFFLAKLSVSANAHVACTGAKTKEVTESMGLKVSFHGNTSDPEKVGMDFLDWLGNRRVLFPLSNRSKKTISDMIPDSQKEEVEVYQTELIDQVIPAQDIYVFTSPSNVDAFLESGNTVNSSKVIAWGSTTQKALENREIQSVILNKPSIDSLIDVLSTTI